MPFLTADEKVQLLTLAQERDLGARGYEDNLAEIAALRAGTEGPVLTARFATTANINLATTGLAAIDGVTPAAGDIALVKNQSTASQNGLYVASSGVWNRLLNGQSTNVIQAGMLVAVIEGSAGAGTQWMLTTANPITVGSTSLTFTQLTVNGISAVTLASTVHGNGAALVGTCAADQGGLASTNVQTSLAELAKYVPLSLADPGTGAAIGVTRSATVNLTIGSSGAETNTLAIPTFLGQTMVINADTVGTGTRAVTSASAINVAGNTHMTFSAVKQCVCLRAVTLAGTLRWEVTSNDGATLS